MEFEHKKRCCPKHVRQFIEHDTFHFKYFLIRVIITVYSFNLILIPYLIQYNDTEQQSKIFNQEINEWSQRAISDIIGSKNGCPANYTQLYGYFFGNYTFDCYYYRDCSTGETRLKKINGTNICYKLSNTTYFDIIKQREATCLTNQTCGDPNENDFKYCAINNNQSSGCFANQLEYNKQITITKELSLSKQIKVSNISSSFRQFLTYNASSTPIVSLYLGFSKPCGFNNELLMWRLNPSMFITTYKYYYLTRSSSSYSYSNANSYYSSSYSPQSYYSSFNYYYSDYSYYSSPNYYDSYNYYYSSYNYYNPSSYYYSSYNSYNYYYGSYDYSSKYSSGSLYYSYNSYYGQTFSSDDYYNYTYEEQVNIFNDFSNCTYKSFANKPTHSDYIATDLDIPEYYMLKDNNISVNKDQALQINNNSYTMYYKTYPLWKDDCQQLFKADQLLSLDIHYDKVKQFQHILIAIATVNFLAELVFPFYAINYNEFGCKYVKCCRKKREEEEKLNDLEKYEIYERKSKRFLQFTVANFIFVSSQYVLIIIITILALIKIEENDRLSNLEFLSFNKCSDGLLQVSIDYFFGVFALAKLLCIAQIVIIGIILVVHFINLCCCSKILRKICKKRKDKVEQKREAIHQTSNVDISRDLSTDLSKTNFTTSFDEKADNKTKKTYGSQRRSMRVIPSEKKYQDMFGNGVQQINQVIIHQDSEMILEAQDGGQKKKKKKKFSKKKKLTRRKTMVPPPQEFE